eukprot:CAMPEP_0113824548 /NCGR_PEP_ID=MMETSP0328-20130328/3298_1 /TAXON_ID=39455 /ORGANISM="Alexandrium minutum" /LENGTH=105 /DNA_ID=CAMNT_0000792489 /DNA_START=110 /DNA_END=424 /DNA_ORIENTATION=+ /assembly_acc=CAM_ASM_000350
MAEGVLPVIADSQHERVEAQADQQADEGRNANGPGELRCCIPGLVLGDAVMRAGRDTANGASSRSAHGDSTAPLRLRRRSYLMTPWRYGEKAALGFLKLEPKWLR